MKKKIIIIALVSIIVLNTGCTKKSASPEPQNIPTETEASGITTNLDNDNLNSENNSSFTTEEKTALMNSEFMTLEYLLLDDKFLLTNYDGVKYIVDKDGNASYVNDVDVLTPHLRIDKNGGNSIFDHIVRDVYGNDVTDKFVKSQDQAAIGITEYENDQVVWVLQREEGFSESYVKYTGYTSEGNPLIEFDSKEYPDILFDGLFKDEFLSGFPIYKGDGIFALRKPYKTAAEVGGGNFITTDGEDITEFNEYINLETNTIFSVDNSEKGVYDNLFDEYSFYKNKLYDLNGNIVKQYDIPMRYLGEGMGMNADDSWLETEARSVYDLFSGEKLIDLSDYQYSLQWVDRFADGYILIDLENDQEHEYVGVMNTEGEWVIEPFKVTESIDGETVGEVTENIIILKGIVFNLKSGNHYSDPARGDRAYAVRTDGKAYYLSNGTFVVYDYIKETTQPFDLYLTDFSQEERISPQSDGAENTHGDNKATISDSSIDKYSISYIEEGEIDPEDFYSIENNENVKEIVKKQVGAIINKNPDEFNSLCNYNLLLQSESFEEYSKLALLDSGKKICTSNNTPYIENITIDRIRFLDSDYIIFDNNHASFINVYSFAIGNSGYSGTFDYIEYYNEKFCQVQIVTESGFENARGDLAAANSTAKTIYNALMCAIVDYDAEGGNVDSQMSELCERDFTVDQNIDNEIFKEIQKYYTQKDYIFYIGRLQSNDSLNSYFVQCRHLDNEKIIGQYPHYSGSDIEDLKRIRWGEFKE